MALPSNDKIPGDLGHTSDHNSIIDEINNITNSYLLQSTASTIYLPISASSNYLQISNASATYLNKTDAASTYLVSSSYTASNILSKLITVDGSGSELDADLLDGQDSTYYMQASASSNFLPTSASSNYVQISTASVTYAKLVSPTFTGVPLAPTASSGNNTTQIATTAFVSTAISSAGGLPSSSPTNTSSDPSAYGHSSNSGVYATGASNCSLYGGITNGYLYIYLSGPFQRAMLSLVSQLWVDNIVTINYSNGSSITTIINSPTTINDTSSNASIWWTGLTIISSSGTYPSASNYPGASSPYITSFTYGQTKSSQALYLVGETPTWGILSSKQVPKVDINPRSASYTLVLSDAGKVIEMGSATAQTLTIPLNEIVPFPVGTKIDVVQNGAGECSVAPINAGVTLNSESGKRKINAQWSSATLIKRSTDTWLLIGSLKV